VLVGPADDASPVAAAAPAKMMLGYSGGGAAGDVQEIIFVVPCWVSTESLLIDKGNKVVSTSSHCFLFMRTTTPLHTLLQVQYSCTVFLLGVFQYIVLYSIIWLLSKVKSANASPVREV